MPILFNASLQTTSDDSSLPKLNTSIIPNTRSRATTLTTHSLHHLKKETLQLQQQQQQDSRNSSGKHSISISCSSSSSASSPSSSISSSSSLSSSIECNPHCKSSHSSSSSSSSSSSIINNKDTITVVTTPAPAPRHSRARRNSTEERDNDNLHHPYQLKQRGYDRTTPSLSPSPSLSLSPPPSSPTSSIDSSDSISDNPHRLHLHHIIYEVQETKSLKDDKSFPLSPPASATTSLPPPSILSNTTVLCSTVSSPEGMDSEEIPSHDHHQKKVLEIQNQLDNYSVGKRTNTERSSSSTSSNSSPLAPSSLWISSSKGRGDESQQQLQEESEQDKEDEPRAKRKRSMASLEQSPLSFENDKQIIKGVVCPLSPPSSNSTTTLSNDEVSIADNNNNNNNDDDAIIIVAVSPKLETVFEGRESCSETTTTTTTTTKKALSDTNNIPAGETGSSILGENSQPDYSTRPPISYAGLIIQVLRESTKIKMTLADIYSAIMQKHPYYRYAASGWQNSVRNSLSLNKAFAKIDRTPGESGHGCFWALQDHVRDSTDPLPCRKRKAPQSDTTSLTPTARSKGSSLPKLDCVTDSTSDCTTPSFLDSAPSPAASEDAEDLKSPRRSGRARRPPRPKEAEDYIGPYPRQPSLSNASLSTPPSSPAPHGQDREVTPVAASARRRASSVKVEKIHPHLTHSDVSRDETTASRKAIQDADLASIPGVVTTQRIRRPPQNLAEFVSSEDFKAAPCGKRQERTLQSSASSSSLNGSETESTPREKKEAKRSKSESHISYCHSGKRSNSMETDQPDADPNQPRESFDRSPSMPDLAAGSRLSHSNPNSQPATIPLSALSHSKCLNSKKQRRDSNSRPKSLYSKRHSSHEVPTRQQILERRRREGKREIMVASEDDWSDSDFDFLRDEEENYRMMRIRVRKIQRTCGRWSLRDNTNDDGFDDAMEDEGFNSDDEQSRVEGEKIKLLMDPSVINYGFDSCDSKYILDFHQGPLFNNVTWPEFSDVKEDSNNGGNGNGNRNPSDNSNPLNNNSNTVHGRVLNSVTEEILHEVDQVNIDAQSVAEVLSELTKSVVLGSESIHPTECIPIIQEPTALPLPLITPSNSTNGEGRKQEAEEWALFVGNCGPKMECNTGASHRNMEIESETKLKDIISPLEEQQHVLPDSEIEAVVAAVASGAVADKNHAQMEDIIAQVTSPIVVVKEEIEAENFIGWSLCE